MSETKPINAIILEGCSYWLGQKIGKTQLPITNIEPFEVHGEMAMVTWYRIVVSNVGTVYAEVNGKYVVEVRYE